MCLAIRRNVDLTFNGGNVVDDTARGKEGTGSIVADGASPTSCRARLCRQSTRQAFPNGSHRGRENKAQRERLDAQEVHARAQDKLKHDAPVLAPDPVRRVHSRPHFASYRRCRRRIDGTHKFRRSIYHSYNRYRCWEFWESCWRAVHAIRGMHGSESSGGNQTKRSNARHGCAVDRTLPRLQPAPLSLSRLSAHVQPRSAAHDQSAHPSRLSLDHPNPWLAVRYIILYVAKHILIANCIQE